MSMKMLMVWSNKRKADISCNNLKMRESVFHVMKKNMYKLIYMEAQTHTESPNQKRELFLQSKVINHIEFNYKNNGKILTNLKSCWCSEFRSLYIDDPEEKRKPTRNHLATKIFC